MATAEEAPSGQLQVQLLAALSAQLQQPELDLNLLFGLFSAVLKEGSAAGAGSVAQLRQVFQVLRSESYQPVVNVYYQVYSGVAELAAARVHEALGAALGAEGRGNIAVVLKAIAEVLLLAGEGTKATPLLLQAVAIFRELRMPGLDVSGLVQACSQLLQFLGVEADGSAVPQLALPQPPEHPTPSPVSTPVSGCC